MKTKAVVIGLLALSLVIGTAAQDAAARKQFAEVVRKMTLKQMGSNLAPGLNLTAEGPDATLYMYHLPGITFDICRSLAEGVREKPHTMGFTQLVCTGGVGDIRFTSDISAQPALPAKANSTVIAEAALPVKTNPAVPQQAQSSQVIKLPLPVQGQKARKKPAEQPVSQYMRGAAIIYLEALQRLDDRCKDGESSEK